MFWHGQLDQFLSAFQRNKTKYCNRMDNNTQCKHEKITNVVYFKDLILPLEKRYGQEVPTYSTFIYLSKTKI